MGVVEVLPSAWRELFMATQRQAGERTRTSLAQWRQDSEMKGTAAEPDLLTELVNGVAMEFRAVVNDFWCSGSRQMRRNRSRQGRGTAPRPYEPILGRQGV